MIDNLAFMLPFLVIAVGLFKRSEMALWLVIITMFSVMIERSGSSYEGMIVFFKAANLILMTACYMCWRINKKILPIIIGIIASIDTVASFIHLIYLINFGFPCYIIGLFTGFTAYLKLALVLFMSDGKGVLNELFNDFRNHAGRIIRLAGYYKNSRHNK